MTNCAVTTPVQAEQQTVGGLFAGVLCVPPVTLTHLSKASFPQNSQEGEITEFDLVQAGRRLVGMAAVCLVDRFLSRAQLGFLHSGDRTHTHVRLTVTPVCVAAVPRPACSPPLTPQPGSERRTTNRQTPM